MYVSADESERTKAEFILRIFKLRSAGQSGDWGGFGDLMYRAETRTIDFFTAIRLVFDYDGNGHESRVAVENIQSAMEAVEGLQLKGGPFACLSGNLEGPVLSAISVYLAKKFTVLAVSNGGYDLDTYTVVHSSKHSFTKIGHSEKLRVDWSIKPKPLYDSSPFDQHSRPGNST